MATLETMDRMSVTTARNLFDSLDKQGQELMSSYPFMGEQERRAVPVLNCISKEQRGAFSILFRIEMNHAIDRAYTAKHARAEKRAKSVETDLQAAREMKSRCELRARSSAEYIAAAAADEQDGTATAEQVLADILLGDSEYQDTLEQERELETRFTDARRTVIELESEYNEYVNALKQDEHKTGVDFSALTTTDSIVTLMISWACGYSSDFMPSTLGKNGRPVRGSIKRMYNTEVALLDATIRNTSDLLGDAIAENAGALNKNLLSAVKECRNALKQIEKNLFKISPLFNSGFKMKKTLKPVIGLIGRMNRLKDDVKAGTVTIEQRNTTALFKESISTLLYGYFNLHE